MSDFELLVRSQTLRDVLIRNGYDTVEKLRHADINDFRKIGLQTPVIALLIQRIEEKYPRGSPCSCCDKKS